MKKKILSAVVAVCLFCSAFSVGVSAKMVGTVGDNPDKTLAVYCRLSAYETYQTSAQTGTAGTNYETTARMTSSTSHIADSWKVTGTFCTAASSTKKTAEAKGANSCSVSVFKSGSDTYISGQFIAVEESEVYGDCTLQLNVTY